MECFQFLLTLWLILLNDLHLSTSIVVRFLNKEPLYVAVGQNLVLEAEFQLQPTDKILLQTWDLQRTHDEIRVAETDSTINNRTHVENNFQRLRINELTDGDYGIYKIILTTSSGEQVSDTRKVLKITNPPKAYLSMKCNVPVQGAQWDSTEYSWQVNGVKITNQTGQISADGSELRLTGVEENYTCTTSSSQGTSKADVHIKESDQPSCSCAGWIGFAITELILLIGLIGFFCWKRRRSPGNGNI